MKKGDLVKIKQSYFDYFDFDMKNENLTYIIEDMESPFGITISSNEKYSTHIIQERYLITIEELKRIERIKKLDRLLEN